MSTRDVTLQVGLAGSTPGLPDCIVLSVGRQKLQLNVEQASALAASLLNAVCALEDTIEGQCAAWSWCKTQQRES